MPNPNLTVRDLAQKLGKSEWGIYLDLKAGLLPGYKLPSGVWRFDEGEIDEYLKACHRPGRTTRLPQEATR